MQAILHFHLFYMLIFPKRYKFRKEHRTHISGTTSVGRFVAFGDYGLKALDNAYVSNRQIEAARKVISRYVRKVGKIWLRTFPRTPVTSHGMEMPMGKGKGDVAYYAAKVKKGMILFEISGLGEVEAKNVFIKASKKLSIPTEVVSKNYMK